MSRYILDTDHLSFLQRSNDDVLRRLMSHPATDIAITIVTVEEQLRGWLAVIRQHHASERQVVAYRGLHDAVTMLNRFTILDFDHHAYSRYTQLRQERLRIGSQDLRIAAIALAIGATLITRNQRDFSQVPQLTHEDWSRPPSPS